MIKVITKMMVGPYGTTPELEDIKTAIKKAKDDCCVVELSWFAKYSGCYSRYIFGDEDPEDFYKNIIPLKVRELVLGRMEEAGVELK